MGVMVLRKFLIALRQLALAFATFWGSAIFLVWLEDYVGYIPDYLFVICVFILPLIVLFWPLLTKEKSQKSSPTSVSNEADFYCKKQMPPREKESNR